MTQVARNFRAFSKSESKMGKVGIHYFNMQLAIVSFYGIDRLLKTDDLILMQSTGLKDKKDREIFEGDVISRNGRMVSVVKFGKWIHEEEFGCRIKNIGFYLDSNYDGDEYYEAMDYEDISKNYEIIGNVYENPELLGD